MIDLVLLVAWVTIIVSLSIIHAANISYYISHRTDKYPELKYWTGVLYRTPFLYRKDVEFEVGYYRGWNARMCGFDKFRRFESSKECSTIVSECKELVSSYESGGFWLRSPKYEYNDIGDIWYEKRGILEVMLWYRDCMYTNMPEFFGKASQSDEAILAESTITPIMKLISGLPLRNVVLHYKVRKMLGEMIDGI